MRAWLTSEFLPIAKRKNQMLTIQDQGYHRSGRGVTRRELLRVGGLSAQGRGGQRDAFQCGADPAVVLTGMPYPPTLND